MCLLYVFFFLCPSLPSLSLLSLSLHLSLSLSLSISSPFSSQVSESFAAVSARLEHEKKIVGELSTDNQKLREERQKLERDIFQVRDGDG